MRVGLVVVSLCGLCCSRGLAVTNTAEVVRSALVTQVSTAKVPSGVDPTAFENAKQITLKYLRDDTARMDEQMVFSSICNSNTDTTTEINRQAFLYAYCFRFRKDGKRLSGVYDCLPAGQKLWFAGFVSVVNEPFIDQTYEELAEKAFRESFGCGHARAGGDVATSPTATGMLHFLISAGGKHASPVVLEILRREVSDSSLRFNLVASSLDQGDSAIDIAKWYYEEYCFKPFEIKILSEYLTKYLPSGESSSWMANKARLLKEAVDALSPTATIDKDSRGVSSK